MSDKKSIVTQPEASPLRGDNASINVPQDALGMQGKKVVISQTQSSGGMVNVTSGVKK